MSIAFQKYSSLVCNVPFEFFKSRGRCLRQTKSKGDVVEDLEPFEIFSISPYYSRINRVNRSGTVSVVAVGADCQDCRNFGVCDRLEDITVNLLTSQRLFGLVFAAQRTLTPSLSGISTISSKTISSLTGRRPSEKVQPVGRFLVPDSRFLYGYMSV
jgi:hypothetical protein